MNNVKANGQLIGKIGNRQIFFKKDSEKSIDWAEAFAKLIIRDNVEEYLVRNGLYKETTETN